MSFFHILFSVCSGTSVFPELKKQTLGRAIWHLCLLAFLCTVLIGIAVYFIHSGEVESVAHRFFEQTGDIVISPDEIVLEKDPDRSRSYLLNPYFRFDYMAKESDLNTVKPGEWKENGGILCFRNLAALWLRNPESDSCTFRLFCLPVHILRNALAESAEKQKEAIDCLAKGNTRSYSSAELQKKLKETLEEQSNAETVFSPEMEKALKSVTLKLDEDNTVPAVCSVIVVSAVTAVSMEMTFMLLFTVIFITVFLHFRNKREANQLTTKQLAVVTIYTAFPPLVIYTVFQMVSLPSWLSAEFLYFASFFIYQIFVLRTVYNDGRHPEIPEE